MPAAAAAAAAAPFTLHNVVVAGGFGGVGAFITRELLATKAFASVKVIGRGSSSHKELQDSGATYAAVDYDSVDSIAAALAGADAVISTIGGAGLYQAQLNLVDAATKAGTVKLFLPSEFGIDLSRVPEAPLFGGKLAVADKLYASGLNYTFVSTGFFTDTFFVPFLGFDLTPGAGFNIAGDGHAKNAFTHRADIGKFVAQILLHPHVALNKHISVHSDVLTAHEIAALVEAITGNKQALHIQTLADIRAKITAKPGPTSFDNLQEQFILTIGNGDGAHYKSDNHLFPAVHPSSVKAFLESALKK